MTVRDARAPIGVFDSGVGGLTVLAALRMRMPHERFVYLGDTARLPYGTKTGGTVARYALQAARCLMQRDVKMIVVACNTASAVAIEPLGRAKELSGTPVVGVVEPGAAADLVLLGTGWQRARDRLTRDDVRLTLGRGRVLFSRDREPSGSA